MQELKNINKLIKITYDDLVTQFPKTSSRNYKSNLKKFIKNVMEYELLLDKDHIVFLIKNINIKQKNIIYSTNIINMDLDNLREDYHKISNTYSELVNQKYTSNLVITNSVELATAMTQFDLESPSSRNHISSQLIRSSEAVIKNKLCQMTLEIKKNEITLKLLKKIKYHLNFSLSKYC